MNKPRLPDGITARDIRQYELGARRLRELADSRPILNPNGPTPLVPGFSEDAQLRPVTLGHTFWDSCSTEPA